MNLEEKIKQIIRGSFAKGAQELWGDSDVGPWEPDCHEAHVVADKAVPQIVDLVRTAVIEERQLCIKDIQSVGCVFVGFCYTCEAVDKIRARSNKTNKMENLK